MDDPAAVLSFAGDPSHAGGEQLQTGGEAAGSIVYFGHFVMVLDGLSYRVVEAGRSATFRLQLVLSTTGLRQVAIAIQDVTEGGN